MYIIVIDFFYINNINSPITIHFNLHVVDWKGKIHVGIIPFLLTTKKLITIFLRQLVTCYFKGYQVICLFILYYKGHVKISCQGTTYLVHYQIILPSTPPNKLNTHQNTLGS